MTLIEDLKWRYATKKMNGKAVPQDKVDYIIEAARLAPSSSGIQPYRIFVITNKEKLKQIQEVAYNQSQIVDCSHLLVFAAWDGYTESKIANVFSKTAEARSMPESSFDDYKNSLWAKYNPLGQEWQHNHAAKQAYISLGMAIAAAAEQKVDATPMEGFEPSKLDDLLGFDKLGLKSVLLLPLGYRDEQNDWLVNMKKYRTANDEFVTVIS